MSRSMTVRLPSARNAAMWLGALLLIALLAVVVYSAVRALVAGGPAKQVATGSLQEIHTLDGSVYVGRVIADEGGLIQMTGVAVVREVQPSSEPSASPAPPRLVVQAFYTDPFDVQGTVAFSRESIKFIANVTPDSGLDQAYRQAVGSGTSPTASPAP